MQNIIKLITVLSIIFVLSIFYISLNRNTNYDTENLVGKKLGEIKLKSFQGNEYFTNEILKNNDFTLINFWASWCAPCRVEHPFLMELSKLRNLKLVGVNFKDKKNNALNFLNNLGNPFYYLAKDEQGKQSVSFGIYGIPETILINEDLKIIKKYVGPIDDKDVRRIKKIINK